MRSPDMDPFVQWFVASLAIGLLLIGIEVIVPGGVIGAFGALALAVSVILAFLAFGPRGGGFATLSLIILGTLAFAGWIRIFPKTAVGRSLTLRGDGKSFHSADPSLSALLGQEGVAHTSLRPGGLAVIGERRVDVVSNAGFIEAGTPLRVVHVEGSRVCVEPQA